MNTGHERKCMQADTNDEPFASSEPDSITPLPTLLPRVRLQRSTSWDRKLHAVTRRCQWGVPRRHYKFEGPAAMVETQSK